ncbi:MAG: YebC/PmpR family DNA-binding transcriptional regulator [Bacteroidia bacterium]|nr:YebC/PmpR family DNA-binding transcriptional regulator [Bacteroidia bacterium]MCX7763823.1 YebC/PmpR family DNA-binding transcriptional regulator [Bacteroidia bacterium]MDW8056657.1 YebC/PmpR family DNA-binding transcriptional regulator [Bacteroidia bacterium]
MAGHSKWAQIKRKKAIVDAKRGALFTRLVREITVAAREGGPNPDFNPRLRLAIQNARRANMPKDVIERAISKGDSGAENYTEVMYEGYAPGGVAVLIEAMTDNTNRTVSQLRTLFSRGGGSLATSGAVSYLFSRKGVFTIPAERIPQEETFLEAMIEAGAEDVEISEDTAVVTCSYESFGALQEALEKLKIEPEEASLAWVPSSYVQLSWEEAQKALRLIEQLEEHDDVQKVYHNLAMTEEIAAHYAATS